MNAPELRIAVIMERRTLANRWQAQSWEAIGIIPDLGGDGEPRALRQDSASAQWLYSGFAVKLFRDEAENYYLNLSTACPAVFVIWRMDEDVAVPKFVTVSYGEAARFMDAGEQVDRVLMPQDMRDWLDVYVRAHYRPEPKKRSRPPSFDGARRG